MKVRETATLVVGGIIGGTLSVLLLNPLSPISYLIATGIGLASGFVFWQASRLVIRRRPPALGPGEQPPPRRLR